MTDHTTHFDDCGCKSKRLEAEIARIKTECDNGTCPSAMHERMAAAQAVPMHEMKRLEAERDAARADANAALDDAAKANAEAKALRLRVAALEAACLEVRRWFDPKDTHGNFNTSRHMVEAINAALGGDTTALRAMLVEAAHGGIGDDQNMPLDPRAKQEIAEAITDRILGASKGGGE